MGGGACDGLGGFLSPRQIRVAVLNGNQLAEDYCNVLRQYLRLLMNVHIQNRCDVLFQQG